jgi:hypothetical protein
MMSSSIHLPADVIILFFTILLLKAKAQDIKPSTADTFQVFAQVREDTCPRQEEGKRINIKE